MAPDAKRAQTALPPDAGDSGTPRVTRDQPVADPATRTQRRAKANRQAIIAVAREIIATQGEAALTLDAVAAQADVAVQTIYNRVGGRSALLLAVAEQAMQESRAYMNAAYSRDGSAEDRIRHAALAYARFAAERPHEFRILLEPPDEPEAVARIVELTNEQNRQLVDTITQAVTQGDARSDLDPADVAVVLSAALNGLVALTWWPGAADMGSADFERLLDVFAHVIADGLHAPKTPDEARTP